MANNQTVVYDAENNRVCIKGKYYTKEQLTDYSMIFLIAGIIIIIIGFFIMPLGILFIIVGLYFLLQGAAYNSSAKILEGKIKEYYAKLESSPKSSSNVPKNDAYEFLHIKVVGVTFENADNSSRQSILRDLKSHAGVIVDLELKPYEWEGSPAYGIYANGMQIGNVPKDMVPYIEENYSRIIDFSGIKVYGGGRGKSYGCKVTLRLKKNDRSGSHADLFGK